jgi:hypothetical protein
VSTTPAERLGTGRYLVAGSRPESTIISVHELAATEIIAWLAKRYELTPPA